MSQPVMCSSTEGGDLMGRTVEHVRVQNFVDMVKVSDGILAPDQVRTVEFDALVDTGAAYLCLPPELIQKLGLKYSFSRSVTTANGLVTRRIFKGADITIRDRNEQMSVMENDEQTPPLIGYLVLETLDFIVNPKSQQLMGNPEHDGKWVVDCY